MLISENYRKEQQRLHEKYNYGVVGKEFAPMVSTIANSLQIGHLLDYGCGSRLSLVKNLKIDHECTIQTYDPGVPRFAERPFPAEMVACIDVLEHIEPECLDDVLDDLERVTLTIGFFTVHTGPAGKKLSDGRNAHLIQQPMEWWLPKIWERFDIHTFQATANGFYLIVYAKQDELPTIEGDDERND